MDEKKCFFIGHRETPTSILSELRIIIHQHITQYNVTEFIVGNRGNFDRLAASVILDLKKQFPQIRLILLLPYLPTSSANYLPDGFDGSCYPSGLETVPKAVAIPRANRYMVENVDYLIACVWHSASNALTLTEYAEKRAQSGKIVVTRLSPPIF